MATSHAFRNTFKVAKERINWYPGHMKHSFTHMEAKMRSVDLLIEVHDSRIPFSGRNPLFLKTLIGTKPHILVLTKKDLIDPSMCKVIENQYREQELENIVFVNSLNQKCKGVKSLVPLARRLTESKSKAQATDVLRYKMLVVGIPNVGKSSLINALRHVNLSRGKATPVGAVAGVTRSVMNEIKVCQDPPMYLIDTPGILFPNINDSECGMKLALCACLKDDLVDVQIIADFLLYWMNKTRNFKYVDMFNLTEPTDAIMPVLIKIALSLKKFKKVKNISENVIHEVPDVHSAALHMVKQFRTGKLGDLNLDTSHVGFKS